MTLKHIALLCTTTATLWGTTMLPTSGKPDQYINEVSSDDGKRIALMGTGKEINTYIADRISLAGKNDTIRLDYYIMDYERKTYYFYNAIKEALANGAKVEIITEGKNTSKAAYLAGDIPEYRYRNQREFFYGAENAKYDGFVAGLLEEPKAHKNAFKFYKVDRAGDSTSTKAINHRKIALLDIDGKKEIVVSTANITGSGESRWQAAIVLDGNHYDSQWRWWNDVLDTDICFAKMGSQKECRLGNGGYESNYEGWTASYVVDKTKYETMVEWLKKMKYSKGCALRMLMGHLGSTKVLNEMKRIAEDGCKVDLIYASEYIDGSPYKYNKGNFEVEHQARVHAKMILWQGKWGNGDIEQYAWVGSLNATDKGANENDETMVRIEGKKLFKAFWNYFQWVEYDD